MRVSFNANSLMYAVGAGPAIPEIVEADVMSTYGDNQGRPWFLLWWEEKSIFISRSPYECKLVKATAHSL